MGYYIEVPQRFGKAQQLVEMYDAEIIPKPVSLSLIPQDKALICVVHNRAFEGAGYCYNTQEFHRFSEEDGRARNWLLMDKKKAQKLTGYKEIR